MAVEKCCPSVTVIVPVFSGSETLSTLIARCQAIRNGHYDLPAGVVTQLIFVCDEPIDDSESVLRVLGQGQVWIQVVSLARNSGQHLASAVGMLYSSGDWIYTIDEDLQHPPELLGKALQHVLKNSLDVLYIKSIRQVHVNNKFRDLTSIAAKRILQLVTRDDYSNISSFRLIRGEIARSIANSMDGYSYLDALIYSVAGKNRRGVYYGDYCDSRVSGKSGYSIAALLHHFGRFVISAEFSGLQFLASLMIVVLIPLSLLFVLFFIIACAEGVHRIAPGWLSLFSLCFIANVMIVAFGVYSLKLLSSLNARVSGTPPFLVIDRSIDNAHLTYLNEYFPRQEHPIF